MNVKEQVQNINNYYKDNSLEARDIELINYCSDLIKIGLSWDITDPYDELLILKNVDLISCPMEWTCDTDEDFIFYINNDDAEYENVLKKYNNKSYDGFNLIKIKSDFGNNYYFSVKEIIFIPQKMNIHELLKYKVSLD